MAIVALLVGILLPSLTRAQDLARRGACAANLKELVRGCTMYAQTENLHYGHTENMLPTGDPGSNWGDAEDGNLYGLWLLLERDICSPTVFACPEALRTGRYEEPDRDHDGFRSPAGNPTCTYSYLSMVDDDLREKSNLQDLPTGMVILGDANPRGKIGDNSLSDDDNENSENHGGDGQNVGKLDGTVKWYNTPSIADDDIYASGNGGSSAKREDNDDILLIP